MRAKRINDIDAGGCLKTENKTKQQQNNNDNDNNDINNNNNNKLQLHWAGDKLMKDRWMERRMDGPTDGQTQPLTEMRSCILKLGTDRWTYGPTDTTSINDA